jgi:hypothetical protein
MADDSAVMTMARIQIVQLRQIALTYHALVHRGVLLPKEAANLFREPVQFLDGEQYNPEIVQLHRESHEALAKQIEGLRPGNPLPSPARPPQNLDQ